MVKLNVHRLRTKRKCSKLTKFVYFYHVIHRKQQETFAKLRKLPKNVEFPRKKQKKTRSSNPQKIIIPENNNFFESKII